jgi:hypothetical protein
MSDTQARKIEVYAAQIRSYEAALAWYADPDNWTVREHRRGDTAETWSWTGADLGERARIALARWRENKR